MEPFPFQVSDVLFRDDSVSSQLVTWQTRNQVNLYPGSPLVTCANHEIVRAVLTERQTSDCDVKCRITFSFLEFLMYTGLDIGSI